MVAKEHILDKDVQVFLKMKLRNEESSEKLFMYL